MIASTEILDTLKSIGLNLYERKIFVALLAKGVATAAEVSEIANVPRSRSYDVLESLADKGFVMVQPAKPIKYVALKPAEALERVKENMNRNHNIMIERIDKLKGSDILNQLEGIYKEGLNLVNPSEMTGTLKGGFVINRQLRSIFKNAREKIDILTTERGLTELYSNHFRTLKKLVKNGVKLRIIAPLTDEEIKNAFSPFAELSHTDSSSGRIFTVDGRHLVMSLTDDDVHESQDVFLWTDSPHVVKSMSGPLFSQFNQSDSAFDS